MNTLVACVYLFILAVKLDRHVFEGDRVVQRQNAPTLIVRVAPFAPGMTRGEPAEFHARLVEPMWTSTAGKGKTPGEAVDALLGMLTLGPGEKLAVIVDQADGPARPGV